MKKFVVTIAYQVDGEIYIQQEIITVDPSEIEDKDAEYLDACMKIAENKFIDSFDLGDYSSWEEMQKNEKPIITVIEI